MTWPDYIVCAVVGEGENPWLTLTVKWQNAVSLWGLEKESQVMVLCIYQDGTQGTLV